MRLLASISGVSLFLVTATVSAADLVFAAPPRGSLETEQKIYQPIVDLISQVTGKSFVFRYSQSWLGYEAAMLKDAYDVVFDGPHFIGWRMAKLGHTPLVRLDGNLSFVVVARKDSERIRELKDLAGRKVCAFAPPNLATLTLYNAFANPARQPIIAEINKGFKEAYDGVLGGKCDGGVMQAALYAKFDEGSHKGQTQVLFRSQPVPNQGISVSRRITPEMQKKIADALLGPAGQKATAALREEFKKDFVPAKPEEYQGLGVLLKDTWGFAL